ncbi:MAG: phospholipase [Pseudopedobacter saltans]|uniref:Phospholipase n=1 Tax=Pseudopedobacter saltans TaxID=151895 RepID=A0A2W5GDS5_9SPHI|nr:MAG: phospholipase [Pseudopedobacter saltans]
MKKSLVTIISAFICLHALSQNAIDQFQSDSIIEGSDTLRYRILYPKGFDPSKQYPLFFFLHGSGERGKDNTSQLKYVMPFMESIESQHPSVIIAPQCPDSSFWAKIKSTPGNYFGSKREIIFYPESTPTPAMRLLVSLTKKWQSEKFIDKNMVYIGGLSMGGMGTYELLIRKPIPFAAAFVICGGTNVITLKQKLGKTPIWIFHGANDPIVPVEYGRQVSSMLQREKKEVKYTEYPGVGHDSWLNAFQEKELIPWLYQHKR